MKFPLVKMSASWLLVSMYFLRSIVLFSDSSRVDEGPVDGVAQVFLEADESTRMRMGNSIPHHHEDHIAGKGENSLQHYNLVHKFIPMPQALKILAAKAAVDKECEKIGENFGVELDESQK